MKAQCSSLFSVGALSSLAFLACIADAMSSANNFESLWFRNGGGISSSVLLLAMLCGEGNRFVVLVRRDRLGRGGRIDFALSDGLFLDFAIMPRATST